MPHIATWWCGQKSAREEVLSRLDEIAIEGAYGRGVPGFPATVRCWRANCAGRSRAAAARSTTAASTMSARNWCGCRRRRSGKTAASRRGPSCCGCLPGDLQGLDHHARRFLPNRRRARCPCSLDGRRRAGGGRLGGLRQGGVGFDAAAGGRHRAHPAHRRRGPSRAADNLFWLGRYLERAEATLRLIRALGTPCATPRRDRRPALPSVEHPAASGDLGRGLAGDADQSAKVVAEALQSAEKFGSACRW